MGLSGASTLTEAMSVVALGQVELLSKVHAWCKYHDTRLRAIKVKEDVDELKVKVRTERRTCMASLHSWV